MTDHHTGPEPDALDALVDQLLGCGAVLSQIISHMVAFDASGLAPPDTAPIPEVAHALIRGVILHLPERHSAGKIGVAAQIVAQVTGAICDEVLLMPLSEFERLQNGNGSG